MILTYTNKLSLTNKDNLYLMLEEFSNNKIEYKCENNFVVTVRKNDIEQVYEKKMLKFKIDIETELIEFEWYIPRSELMFRGMYGELLLFGNKTISEYLIPKCYMNEIEKHNWYYDVIDLLKHGKNVYLSDDKHKVSIQSNQYVEVNTYPLNILVQY